MKENFRKSLISCAILIGTVSILAVFGQLTGTICPLNYIFGVPCPLCGMTRAYLCVLILDLAAAFSMHPLFWMLPIVLTAVFLQPFFKRFDRIFNIFYIAVGVVFILVWIIRMILYFPHTEPMIFYYGSVLSYILGLFGLG